MQNAQRVRQLSAADSGTQAHPVFAVWRKLRRHEDRKRVHRTERFKDGQRFLEQLPRGGVLAHRLVKGPARGQGLGQIVARIDVLEHLPCRIQVPASRLGLGRHEGFA